MKKKKTLLKFDFQSLLSKKVRQVKDSVDNVSINLPFVSFSIKPENKEKAAAKEIVIRLSDKRVLNAFECCDDCIQRAFTSLQEIRSLLVDKQVALMDYTDSALYLLIELIIESIRQFFTYVERNKVELGFENEFEKRELYFGTLELLRSHIFKCMIQISHIASMKIPKISSNMRYSDEWELIYYKEPIFIDGTTAHNSG